MLTSSPLTSWRSLFQWKCDSFTSMTPIHSFSFDSAFSSFPNQGRSQPERAIPDGQGGSLVTVSTPPALYHSSSGGGTTKLGLPITPFAPFGDDLFVSDAMLLGEDGTAYIAGSSLDGSNTASIAAVDTSAGGVKWTVPGSRLSTVTSDGSLAFQYSTPDTLLHNAFASPTGQVTPLFPNPDNSDAGPVIADSFGLHIPSYWTLGAYHAFVPDLSLAAITGSPISSGLSYSQAKGSGQKQDSIKKPEIAHFIPFGQDVIGIDPQAAIDQIKQTLPQPSVATHHSFIKSAATVKAFTNTLAKPLAAVGFIGHSVDVQIPNSSPAQFYSVGLSFNLANEVLVLPPNSNPPFPVPAYANSTTTTQILTQAKVVFIGACFIGPTFQSIWNINNQTTGKAMIVLQNPYSTTYLGHALTTWAHLLDDLILLHMNVQAAVNETNAYLLTLPPDVNNHPVTEQWQVIGDGNVKIN